MSLRNVLLANSILATVFGLAFLLMPDQTLNMYGVDLDASGLYLSRLFGAALIGYGVLSWLAKDATSAEVGNVITMAFFVGYVIGFIVALMGQLAGAVNALGWTTVVIYLVFALLFGYIQFMPAGRMARA